MTNLVKKPIPITPTEERDPFSPEKIRTYLAHDWKAVHEELAQCTRCGQYDDPYQLEVHDYDCHGDL
jgi:hypothetical protein